jgi:hypothetical protein
LDNGFIVLLFVVLSVQMPPSVQNYAKDKAVTYLEGNKNENKSRMKRHRKRTDTKNFLVTVGKATGATPKP